MKKLTIAQIVPVWGVYKPKYSIGINAVARDLSRGLMKKGHQVKIIAPQGSKVDQGMELLETIPSASKRGLSLFDRETIGLSLVHAQKAARLASGVDLIHNHMEYLFLPLVRFLKKPVISTIHGTEFPPEATPIFESFPGHFFVAISKKAVDNLPFVNFKKVVYNGIDLGKYKICQKKKDFLFWMGRLVPEKGAHLAIEVAKRTGTKLVLAGLKEKGGEDYFKKIKEEAQGSAKITLLGRLTQEEKNRLLSQAQALLFPIRWQEPFGLVMVEAMACGTPVIGFANGAVPEVVRDGVTGFIIDNKEQRTNNKKFKIKKTGVEGMVEAVEEINKLSDSQIVKLRKACRRHVEENFTIEKMVENYEEVYYQLLR